MNISFSIILLFLFPALADAGIQITSGISGSWYNPSQDGHGFALEVLPKSRLSVYWFAYEPNGNQAWMNGVGEINGDMATVPVIITQGGNFGNNFDPRRLVREDWGNLTFTFDSCDSGFVTYDIGFGSGRIPIIRLSQHAGLTCNEPLINDRPNVPPLISGNWYRPTPLVTWQWQLSGTVNTSYDVAIYNIDLFDSSEVLIQQLQASGKKVICYFSAGSYEEWRPDAHQFTADDLGNPLDNWPGERWLDIRSTNVHSIVKNRLDLAIQKGCDGVEPDNVDGYTNNSGFLLTAADQLAFNRFIANEAHSRSLSVGLKNDLDQIDELIAYYDFAVNEECFELSECDALTLFINHGKAVLNAEYKKEYVNDENVRNALCADALNRQFSTLILPLQLDDKFRFSCL